MDLEAFKTRLDELLAEASGAGVLDTDVAEVLEEKALQLDQAGVEDLPTVASEDDDFA